MPLATLELPDLDATGDFAECWEAFTPLPVVRMLPWCEANIVTDTGRPYDNAAYPHHGAPGGPMDAFDDPTVREISLQWGVRLGKSFFGQCACCKTAATNPAPMMFASAREKLGKEVTTRTYEMLRRSVTLRQLLIRHERMQKQDLIEFAGCKLYVAWAKSAATLADKNIKVGHANEIDKWEHTSTSKEGDPLDLFSDRFNDYWITRKVINEGTPTVKGRSRIERKRLAGWNCSFWVPCPLCRHYQIIEFGDRTTKYGLKWDRGADGRRHPDVAKTTARYVCRHCEESIPSEARPWMMRRGVWCPEGAWARSDVALQITEGHIPQEWRGWKNAPWIEGTPARDGEHASYHLPTLCALSIPDWGDFARRFVLVIDKPQSLRAFLNQWLAKTWELSTNATTWEELGKRLITDIPREICPPGTVVLTAGVDKQADHFKWSIDAWRPGRGPHTIAYGSCSTLAELAEQVVCRRFPMEGGESRSVRMTLIDSGFRPADVYRFCRLARKRGWRVLPCKGASKPLNTYVLRSKLGPKTSSPGQQIVLVDTHSSQDWIDRQLHVLKPGDEGSRTLHAGSLGEHQDYLEQLLNDALVPSLDTSNNVAERWQRIDEHTPNDFRDTGRYSFAALMLLTRGAPLAARRQPVEPTDRPKPRRKSTRPVFDPTSPTLPRVKLPFST